MTSRSRQGRAVLSALVMSLLLACAPGFWGGDDEPAPVNIEANWQCPTPSPQPTEVSYQPTPPPPPDATYPPGAEPTPGEDYTTPVPTATPYVRTGSDYYMNQRVSVNRLLMISVTRYTHSPAPTEGMAYHQVTVRIENSFPGDLPVVFDLATIRTIKRTDGRMVQGEWIHNRKAAQALGISPDSDPELDEDASGNVSGGYPTGITERTFVYLAPDGEAQHWGMTFSDAGGPRDGGAGSGQVWILLRTDPNCVDPGGAASENLPPSGGAAPSTGSGRWPVPLDTPITRGYGCHPFFTGVHGPCGSQWWHDGIDFASAPGTPLYATRDITIEFAGPDSSSLDCSWIDGSMPPHFGFGQYIRAKDGPGYTYWYGHILRWRVNSGSQVTAGTQVADMGSTGCSTGSHLHFRVRLNGVDRNPLDVISR